MKILTQNDLKMYLGTGLIVKIDDAFTIGKKNIGTLVGLNQYEVEVNGILKTISERFNYENVKPILYPLSMLTKKELIKQGFSSHIDYLTHEKQDPLKAPFEMVQYLFSKRYDVLNLISQNKAIAATNEFNPYK